MTRHIDDSLLQDSLEGLLDPEAEGRLREHLDECSQCREELEAMTELLDGLGDLAVEAQPSRDLWPQIAWRMKSARTRRPAGRGRRVNLPAWQLLVASIALIVISGGSMWAFLSGRMEAGGPLDPLQQTPAQLVGWQDAYSGYDDAVADLETVLEKGREVLDPETVPASASGRGSLRQHLRTTEETHAHWNTNLRFECDGSCSTDRHHRPG